MKIAVIGTGCLAKRHLQIWAENKAVEVVGIIARNQERLTQVAEEFQTKAFTSIEELLAEVDVDVFDVCTPTSTHVELVKQVANAKKHVICSKPLALTTAGVDEIIQACKDNDVQLLVGHTLQFFPEYANAKEQVANGAIGNPGIIRMSRGVPHPEQRDWYADEAQSGGLFFDLGIHEYEWIQSTFGNVERVMGKTIKHTNEDGKSLEYGFVTLRLESGAIVNLELSWAEKAFRASFELTGNKGMITYDHAKSNPIQLATDVTSVELPKSMLGVNPFERQLAHFINCLNGKAESIVLLENVRKAVAIAEAVQESVKTGQPVTLKEDN